VSKFLIIVMVLAANIVHGIDLATERALEFARLFGSSGYDRNWRTAVLPEYWHPEGNDSGLPPRPPEFLPTFPIESGLLLYTGLVSAREYTGKSRWLLSGRQEIRCVELIYTAVAEVDDVVTIFPRPRQVTKFYAMAIDPADAKWKFLESYPYGLTLFEVPYFLKAWERIKGKGSVKNIEEVRARLLALAGPASR